MQHFESILSTELMCTTCCTTRSLNRAFVSHPCSRVSVVLSYLLCYTTISIVSGRKSNRYFFPRHSWRNVASGNGTSGVLLGFCLMSTCQLVGTAAKEIQLALTHIFEASCCILCCGTFHQYAWHFLTSLGRLVTSWSPGKTGEAFFFLIVPTATDTTTSTGAAVQQPSS